MRYKIFSYYSSTFYENDNKNVEENDFSMERECGNIVYTQVYEYDMTPENTGNPQDSENIEDCLPPWLIQPVPVSQPHSDSSGELVPGIVQPMSYSKARHAGGHFELYPVHPEEGFQQSSKMFSYAAGEQL